MKRATASRIPGTRHARGRGFLRYHWAVTGAVRGLLGLLLGFGWAVAAPHPLAPLTAEEIRAADQLYRASGRLPSSAHFSLLTLDDPPKASVPRHLTTPPRPC